MRFFEWPFLVSRPKSFCCAYLSETAVAISCPAQSSALPQEQYLSGPEHFPIPEDGRPHVLFKADPILPKNASSQSDMAQVLTNQVRELGLVGSDTSVVLGTDYYNLSIMERPEVAEDEVKEAVRWRMQDNLEYPVEEAVIDTFDMPASASIGRQDMVFVVAINKHQLQTLADAVLSAKLSISRIDVTEMALRNITELLSMEGEESISLVRMTPRSGIINITEGNKLFLSRRLTGHTGDIQESEWDSFKESTLLQVQRSMDYYQSALAQPQPSQLLVTATQDWERRIVAYFDEMLSIPVTSLHELLCRRLTITAFNPAPIHLDIANLNVEDTRALAAALPSIGGVLPLLEKNRASI